MDLRSAARAGDLDRVTALLAEGANLGADAPWPDRDALATAADAGHIAVMEALLQAGAPAGVVEQLYRSALHSAAKTGRADMVRLLLAHDAPADLASERGPTPLVFAAAGGHVDVATALLDGGADPNVVRSQHDYSVLATAAKNGHLDVVRVLLARHADVQNRTGYRSPLTQATLGGHVDVVAALLAAGADLQHNNAPLHAAAREGHAEIARLLLQAGVRNVDEFSVEFTPLHEAAERGHTEVVEMLVAAGANVDELSSSVTMDNEHYAALHMALSGGHTATALALVEAGADAGVPDYRDRTPLRQAAALGYADVVAAMLAKGASPNRGDVLHVAAQRGNADMVSLLVEAGANVALGSQYQRSPLGFAASGGSAAAIRVLLAAGAPVEQEALYDAARSGHAEAVDALLEGGAVADAGAVISAARTLQIDIVERLLAAGALANGADDKGDTAVVLAAGRGYPADQCAACVDMLLRAGAERSPSSVSASTSSLGARLPAALAFIRRRTVVPERVSWLIAVARRGLAGWMGREVGQWL